MYKINVTIILILIFLNCTLKSKAEEYQYDEQNRLIKVVYNDKSYIEYEYDITGNIIKEKRVSNIKENHIQESIDLDIEDKRDSNNKIESNSKYLENKKIDISDKIKKENIKIKSLYKGKENIIPAKLTIISKRGVNHISINIKNNDIKKLVKNNQDLKLEYEDKTIKIKKEQLKKIKGKKDFNIQIIENKPHINSVRVALLKSKKNLEKIEQEFTIMSSEKNLDIEIVYNPKEKLKIQYYKTFEVKYKIAKIKNIIKNTDGTISIKTKTGNKSIGILIIKK